VGLRAGLTHDIWTVINPDLTPLQPFITRGDRVFASALARTMRSSSTLGPVREQRALNNLWTLRDQAILEIANRFVTHPWSATFLLIVDPLVTWIWIGALIIALGGLLALWPFPARLRSRRTASAPVDSLPAPEPQPVLEPAPEPVLHSTAVRDPV
jgi:cytochrome c-type biogenesis protein CcmF